MKKSTLRTPNDVANSIELSLNVISDPSKILELYDAIDAFINKWSKNPFLLGEFVNQFMSANIAKGWTPIILVLKTDGKIVGIAPLIIKDLFGMRFVKFSSRDTFSPDFVFDDDYMKVCMNCIFEYLFKTMKCRFVDLFLSVDSPNLDAIKQQCNVRGIGFSTGSQLRHRIIPVESTWDEFIQKKGRRRIIRQIECKLDTVGPWSIDYFENVSSRPDILNKLLDVERRSWKALEPTVLAETEEELLMAWEGSQIITKTKPDFKCSAWFLQINNKTVAYTFVIRYNGMAFIPKTSYDDRYKKIYVGKYINNVAIRDMFNEGQVKTIDFMSEYSFMSFWTSSCLTHVEFSMWNGLLGKLVKWCLSNSFVLRMWRAVLGNLPYKQKSKLKTLLAILD